MPSDGRARAHELERCPNGTIWKPSCKRRSCLFCGPRWARDWRRVLAVNLEATGGAVATIAITGPGAERLPWDEHYCRVVRGRGPHKHSGPRGCRVQERAVREWAETLSYRWRLLRQAARIATKRELGEAPPWVLARVWEPQKRGVPHLHLVVPYETWREKRAADCFRRHIARLAREYDFGGVQGKLAPIEGKEAARYVANYLAGRTAKKSSIRDNISDPNLPRSLLWLTPRLTRETFVTMRTLRRARHVWAWADGRCELPVFATWEEGLRVAVAFRSVYPKRAGPVPAGFDGGTKLELAKLTDAYEQKNRLKPMFYEEKKLRDRAHVIARWAFRDATSPG